MTARVHTYSLCRFELSCLRQARKHYEVLEYVITQRFHIPQDDAGGLIHEVFLAFIRNRSRISDERTWLVGATFLSP